MDEYGQTGKVNQCSLEAGSISAPKTVNISFAQITWPKGSKQAECEFLASSEA